MTPSQQQHKDSQDEIPREQHWVERIDELEQEVERLREALKKISVPSGAFSMDQLTHTENVIERQVQIAKDALDGGGDADA